MEVSVMGQFYQINCSPLDKETANPYTEQNEHE